MSIQWHRKQIVTWTLFAASITTACGAPKANVTVAPAAPGAIKWGTDVPASVVYGQNLTGNVVTLNLAPYRDERMSQSPAPDIPRTKVTVRLPLYANAVPTNQPYPMAAVDFPGSPYLVVAKAEYLLPTDVPTAEAWYKKGLADAGYQDNGTARLGNPKTGVHSDGLRFVTSSNADLQVQLSFQQTKDEKTLLEYWITDILTPPRPSNNTIPNDVTRVNIIYRPNNYLQTKKTVAKTISDAQIISSWVSEVNALTRDTRGAHGCLADTGQGADLAFVTRDQKTIPVHIWPACGNVTVNNGPGLTGGNLWDMVKQVMDPQAK